MERYTKNTQPPDNLRSHIPNENHDGERQQKSRRSRSHQHSARPLLTTVMPSRNELAVIQVCIARHLVPGSAARTRRSLQGPRAPAAQDRFPGVGHLHIEEEMTRWTPAEAAAYFESKGSVRPDPAVVDARGRGTPPASEAEHSGPREARQDLLLSVCCPCCDTLISVQLEKKRAQQREQEANGTELQGVEMRR